MWNYEGDLRILEWLTVCTAALYKWFEKWYRVTQALTNRRLNDGPYYWTVEADWEVEIFDDGKLAKYGAVEGTYGTLVNPVEWRHNLQFISLFYFPSNVGFGFYK